MIYVEKKITLGKRVLPAGSLYSPDDREKKRLEGISGWRFVTSAEVKQKRDEKAGVTKPMKKTKNEKTDMPAEEAAKEEVKND